MATTLAGPFVMPLVWQFRCTPHESRSLQIRTARWSYHAIRGKPVAFGKLNEASRT
jgi:hypothetical protein